MTLEHENSGQKEHAQHRKQLGNTANASLPSSHLPSSQPTTHPHPPPLPIAPSTASEYERPRQENEGMRRLINSMTFANLYHQLQQRDVYYTSHIKELKQQFEVERLNMKEVIQCLQNRLGEVECFAVDLGKWQLSQSEGKLQREQDANDAN